MRGGDTLRLFKYLGKHPVIPETQLLRNLSDGQCSREQQLLRPLHTDVGQIGQEIHSDLTFEQLADILGAKVEFLRQNAQTDIFAQMLLQIQQPSKIPFLES